MIYKNGKEITGIYLGGKAITAVYQGAVLVWEAVRSCFGRGYWLPRKPWAGDDKWKYNQ